MSNESIKEQTKKLDLIMNSINTSKQRHEDIEKRILELEWKEKSLKETIDTLEQGKESVALSLVSIKEKDEAYRKKVNDDKHKLEIVLCWIDLNIEGKNKEIDNLIIWYEDKKKELENSYKDKISKLDLVLDWIENDIKLSKESYKVLEENGMDKKREICEIEWNIIELDGKLSNLNKGIDNLGEAKKLLVFSNFNLSKKNELLESKRCLLESDIEGIEGNILSLKSKKQSIEKEVIELASEKDDYIKKKIALKDDTDILAQKEIYIKNRYKESGIQR